MFQDRVLTCRDCNAEFTFTAAEQQFFEQMGFRHPPRRCKDCRKKKKAADAHHGGGSGGEGHGGGSGRPQRPRGNRPSFPATCTECGAETTVPFEPDPSRATFCPDCYRRRRRQPAPS
jgi:CxxC-x17-CxxC domain-containing protein